METFFIETERIKLYPAQPRFSKEINELILDTFDTLHEWLSFAQYPPTIKETNDVFTKSFDEFVKKRQFIMTVYLKSENKFIGMCDAFDTQTQLPNYDSNTSPYDLGYWLHKSYVGKGYAKEAVTALINYLNEEIKIKLFSIKCQVNNPSSYKVAERLNFKLISTMEIPIGQQRTDWPDKVWCKIYVLQLQ